MLNTYRRILSLLSRREQRRFYLLVVMVLIMGLMEAVGVASILPFLAVLSNPEVVETNFYLSTAFDIMGFTDRQNFLMALGVAVFVVIIAGLGFKTLTLYALMRFSFMRSYSLACKLLVGYLEQPYAWYLTRHSAHLAKTILSEVDEVVRTAMIPGARLIGYTAITVFLMGLLILVEPLVAMVAVGVLGGSYALIFLLSRKHLARIGQDRVRANQERFHIVQECFGGIKHVKLRGLEEQSIRRFRDPALRLARHRTSAQLVGELPRHILEAILFGGMILIVLYKLYISDGDLGKALPIIGLYAFAGLRLFPAAQNIYRSLTALRFAKAGLDILYEDLRKLNVAALEKPAPAVSTKDPIRLREQVELRDVHYSYPTADRQTLNGLTVKITANTTVGLVGETGAGKTTIVDLLVGLLLPQKGSLTVDGVDIDQTNVRSWQECISYVPQQIFLADDTIAGNIAYGVHPDNLDMEAIVRAARIANIHDFVTNELPQGYDTEVGERGIRLSGGQTQRIGIARALYNDPDLLILDEGTSALDTLTERAVMDAIHDLANTKTIIVIAHRLSTVKECDNILLVDQGELTASGTYSDLIKYSEKFSAMAGRMD